MKIQLVVIHNDMVVETLDLEPGRYSVGRSKENNIVVQHFSLAKKQGEIYFEEGHWFYQDAGKKKPVSLSAASAVSLSSQVAVAPMEFVENENASIAYLSQLQAERGALLKKRRIVSAAVVFAVILIPALAYFLFGALKNSGDPNLLLAEVRQQVVELEGVVDPKAIADYKKFAGMTDADFREQLGFCTGFLVDVNVVLTASHCLLGSMVIDLSNTFKLRTADGKKHDVIRVLGFDVKRDFLFLETEGMESYGYLKFAKSYKVGQKVYTVGNVHGEGIAIRDGIMSSETPDINEPDVKFIRYNAGTSPGNSGGPLIDEDGDIVALVFASTGTENYNLGTSAEDLAIGHKNFVEDRKPKTISIAMKKLLNFSPQALLQYMAMPYLSQFDEYPEVAKKFNAVSIDVEVPLALEELDNVVLKKLNETITKEYYSVQSFLGDLNEVTLDWKSFVSEKTPAILPSQFDFSQRIFIKKGERYFPKIAGLIDSPSKADMSSYKDKLKRNGKFDFQAYGYNISQTNKTFAAPEDWVYYKPEDSTGRRKRFSELGGGTPYAQMIVSPQVKIGGEVPELTIDTFLKNALGKQGLLATSASRYARPKSIRDFVIRDLDPKVEASKFVDGLGRAWTRTSFKLFDTTHFFNYCHELPEGEICMARIFNVLNQYLLKTVEYNFRKFILSHLLINPYFWGKDRLMNYLGKEKNQKDVSLQGFDFDTEDGKTWIKLKAFPFRFTIPDPQTIESIRLQTGLFGKSPKTAVWTGYGVEWVKRGKKEDFVCGIGLEPFGSSSRFTLNYLRDRRKQEALKKMKGEDADPLPGVWYKLFRGFENPFQIFGYCAPLKKDPRSEEDYFVDFKKSKALKFSFKTE